MFADYPKIYYPYTYKNGKVRLVRLMPDLTTSIKIQLDLINALSYFEYFTINAEDTPESIAYRYYGDPKLHYLVMLSNEMFDWVLDFPLSDMQLEEYVDTCYTSRNALHHYYNTQNKQVLDKGIIPGAFDVPVTNYEYEYDRNEKKKVIKLLRKEMTPRIEQMIYEALQQRKLV